jgi:hypothetical protein
MVCKAVMRSISVSQNQDGEQRRYGSQPYKVMEKWLSIDMRKDNWLNGDLLQAL